MTQPTDPGWYHEPDGRYSHLAYWDGEKWTGETRREPQEHRGGKSWTPSRRDWAAAPLGLLLGIGLWNTLRLDEDTFLALALGIIAVLNVSLAVLGWVAADRDSKRGYLQAGILLVGFISGVFVGGFSLVGADMSHIGRADQVFVPMTIGGLMAAFLGAVAFAAGARIARWASSRRSKRS